MVQSVKDHLKKQKTNPRAYSPLYWLFNDGILTLVFQSYIVIPPEVNGVLAMLFGVQIPPKTVGVWKPRIIVVV